VLLGEELREVHDPYTRSKYLCFSIMGNGAGEEIRTPESLAAHGLPFYGLKAYASLLENPRVIVDRQLSTPPLLPKL